MAGQFAGRTALITGAGSGIGAATAVVLAERGADVTLLGLGKDGLDAVAALVRSAGGRALVFPGDVGEVGVAEAAVAATVAEFGALHHAVNNAGVAGAAAATADLGIADWRRTLGVNLDGVFLGMRAQIPAILAAGGGAIVVVSSVFADRGGPTADYSASKHALRGLTTTAAKEYADRGIRINELQPGVIDTALTRANPEGTRRVADRGIPMRRTGAAGEIATAVAFLLSDEASYITGTHLVVDGGFLA